MKKRPLCIATIFYILGIIIGLYLKISIAFLLLIFCFIVGLIGYLCINEKKKYILYLVILLMGVTYIICIDMKYENIYKQINEKEFVKIEAIIISDVNEKEFKNTYKVKIMKISDKYKNYQNTYWILNTKKSVILRYGDLVEIDAIFEMPSTARNYKGFDYMQYLKTQKIYGNITKNSKVKVIEHDAESVIEKVIYNISKDIKNRIYKLLPKNIRELCIGILIGEREDISDEINESFKVSSLTHMLAVSGSHIAYIIYVLSIIFSKSGKRTTKMITIIFLLFFMALTKFTPSVERASIMGIITLIGSLIYRKVDLYNNLALSVIIILIINPYTILDIGFQLSYGGTIGIILLNKKISNYIYNKINLKNNELNKKELLKNICIKIKKYILDLFILTISANIVIMPIIALNFNTISITFWISNILAGSIIGMITILGFVTYFISLISINLASILAIPLQLLLQLLIFISELCSKIPFSSITVKTPFVFEIIFYYICIYSIYHYTKTKKIIRILTKKINKIINFKTKIISIMCTIVITISGVFININNKCLKLYFIDVGQGDSTLICTPSNKTILIDGGGCENSDSFDVGKQILFPYLLDRRINCIDYMMISHFDSDHVGGLLYILENMKIKNIIISKQEEVSDNYKRFKEIVVRKNINIIIVNKGDRIQIDKHTFFDILFPTQDLISENVLNNNSIVAKLNYYNTSILFTGDIEETAEKKLIEMYKNTDILKSTILKVAHHGSKSSSIQEIIEKINPNIALIGVGENNTFGHPNQKVLERLKKYGTKIYRTDLHGEISIVIDKKGRIKLGKYIEYH